MTLDSFLTNICHHSGIDPDQVTIALDEKDDQITATINLPEEDSGLFIGYHGETLAGLQRLCRVIFQEQYGDKKVFVNVNEYREQRTEKLTEMMRNAAERVLQSGRPYIFSHLPSHERFVIHSTLSESPEYSELESVSEGEGKNRVLIIRFKSEPEAGTDVEAEAESNTQESTEEATT